MKKFKKLTSALLSLVTAAAMVLPLGVNASATAINYTWSVDSSSPNSEEHTGRGGKDVKFSVDPSIHTDSSPYSIKIENTDYCVSYVERTYNVEPSTNYKFSAMVKYSGYQLASNAAEKESGGCVGEAFSWSNSGYTNSSDWKLMEYKFKTKPDQTTINLALQNGIYDSSCKGTAWFSDVKLEKAETTNSWDILAVIVRNVDANVTYNGKRGKDCLTLEEENDIIKYGIEKTKQTLEELSRGKIKVNSIDTKYVNEALTEKDLVQNDDGGYNVSANKSERVSRILNQYLSEKRYNQILFFVPLADIAGGWWGLGGTEFNGIYDVQFAQYTQSWSGSYKSDYEHNDNYAKVIVHEICHGLEADSSYLLGKENSPGFHDEIFAHAAIDPNISYGGYELPAIRDFLNGETLSGKTLHPSVFYRPNGKFTLVDNDMSVGVGINYDIGSAHPTAPKTLTVAPAEDAADKVFVSWSKAVGATGYQLTLFSDPEYKNVWTNFDSESGSSATYLSPITSGKPYYYGIRAKFTQNGKEVWSDYTYLTYTLGAVNVVYGDIDGNGKFELKDVVTALNMLANNTKPDQHALAAMGITDRTSLRLGDVSKLLHDYVSA